MVFICELVVLSHSSEFPAITYWLFHMFLVGFIECSKLLHILIHPCEIEDLVNIFASSDDTKTYLVLA
jgi:hypothetical protein